MPSDFIKGIGSSLFGMPVAPEAELSRFKDPVALKCSWEPMKRNSANFTSHVLRETLKGDLIFKPTGMGRIFGVLFVLAGLGLIFAYFFSSNMNWPLLLIGSIFLMVGIFIVVQINTPIEFDNQKKAFCRGFGKKKCVSFDMIHGIQILQKLGKVSTSSENYHRDQYFFAYEVNLVLHDCRRVHVMTYLKLNQAVEDSDHIATLVQATVWNGIAQT